MAILFFHPFDFIIFFIGLSGFFENIPGRFKKFSIFFCGLFEDLCDLCVK